MVRLLSNQRQASDVVSRAEVEDLISQFAGRFQLPSGTVTSYPLTLNTSVQSYRGEDRRVLYISEGTGKRFGIVHFDVVPNKDGTIGNLAKLPAGAPRPVGIIEMQFPKQDATGQVASIYISPKGDTFTMVNVKANTRYIFDMIGVFE